MIIKLAWASWLCLNIQVDDFLCRVRFFITTLTLRFVYLLCLEWARKLGKQLLGSYVAWKMERTRKTEAWTIKKIIIIFLLRNYLKLYLNHSEFNHCAIKLNRECFCCCCCFEINFIKSCFISLWLWCTWKLFLNNSDRTLSTALVIKTSIKITRIHLILSNNPLFSCF